VGSHCVTMRCDAVRMACLAVYITFTIAFRIGSEYLFIERLVLVKTFS